MNPPRVHMAIGVWCLTVLCAPGCTHESPDRAGAPEAPPSPNLVLVTVDGLIAGELSVFGGRVATPNLDSVARDGAAWADAWTVCPQTRPAVASYLTGLAPDRHGVLDDSVTSLPDGVPTLASALAEKGYRTGAFPDSSFLSSHSGLLRGFETVADPPIVPPGRTTWLPLTRPAAEGARNFEIWLLDLPAGEPYFAWVHFSGPLLAQMLGAESESADESTEWTRAVGRFDEALGEILATMDARALQDRSAIVIAGTLGDVRGGESDLPGPGYSLQENAIRVPIVARLPGERPNPVAEPLWAPDVPVTLARLGSARLHGAEGRDLLEEDGARRPIFAWGRAPRDQMGWRSLRAVRLDRMKRIEGFESRTLSLDGGREIDPDADAHLSRLLAGRARPGSPGAPLDAVLPLLASSGIEPNPVPEEGRSFGTPASRRVIVQEVWAARGEVRSGRPDSAVDGYGRVLRLDPDNLASRVGLGEIQIAQGSTAALETLIPAVERYPGHPEVLHWYSHAIWLESWEQAENLLEVVLPFKAHDGDVLYDLACARSLAGDSPAAERYLRAAIEAGYHPWEQLETDPDLRHLRESGGFARVLRDYRR